ncbi:MAG: hypothetical protein AAF361_14995, partial [Bacteroidota bacterium]
MRYILPLVFTIVLLSCAEKKENIQIPVADQTYIPQLDPDRYNVAFLIMDGTYNTEFTAPFDIFQHTQYRKGIKSMNTFSVANTKEPVISFEGFQAWANQASVVGVEHLAGLAGWIMEVPG